MADADDGEWFRFDTPHKRAIRVAILPEIAEELMKSAHAQGISIETIVNVFLIVNGKLKSNVK